MWKRVDVAKYIAIATTFFGEFGDRPQQKTTRIRNVGMDKPNSIVALTV